MKRPLALIIACWTGLSFTHAAPPECDTLGTSIPDCTLPTIIQCPGQEPECTASSTRSFPKNCFKCKNLLLSKEPLTAQQGKEICDQARQEVPECQDTVIKCGNAAALCGGVDRLLACHAADHLVLCENPKGDAAVNLRSSATAIGHGGRFFGLAVVLTVMLWQ